VLIRTLHFEQASIIAAVLCSLIVAGFLKGIIGVGMPVVALPRLSLFIDIKSVAMLLSMPLIFSNVSQALEGGKTGRCLMQLMPVFLGMIPRLFLGVSTPVGARCERCKDYRRPCAYGCRRHHAARAEAAASVSLGVYQPAGFWEASQRCRDRLFLSFCLQRDCAERRSQRKHRCISSFPAGSLRNSSDGQPPVQLA